MKPVKLTKFQLICVLKNIITAIENDDSFEGGINYTSMDEDNPCEVGEFMVQGCWRTGNLDGQGYMQVIGKD